MTCSRKCFFACPAKLNRETNVCSFMQGISFWQSLICPFFLANQKVHLHYLLILSENNNQSLSQVLIFGKNLELGLLSSNMNPSKRQNGMFGPNVQTILSRFCLEERGRNVCKQSRIHVVSEKSCEELAQVRRRRWNFPDDEPCSLRQEGRKFTFYLRFIKITIQIVLLFLF